MDTNPKSHACVFPYFGILFICILGSSILKIATMKAAWTLFLGIALLYWNIVISNANQLVF